MNLPALRLRSSRPASGLGAVVVAALVGAAGIIASQAGFAARAAVGVLGLVIFIFVAASNRRLALTMVLVWLILLGFTRRFLIPFVGWSTQDPLLLVSPAAAVVLLAISIRREPPPRRTMLSGIALFLLLVSLAEVFNPNEVKFVVALQSLLFYVTPLMWFFVGQRLSEGEHHLVPDVMVWTSVPVLALGYYHSLVGLLPFDYHWLGVSGQSAAIFLPGFQIRPFSTFSSPQEYGYFLGFLLVVILAKLYHRPRHPVVLLVLLAATGFALVLQSSRTVFIFTMLAVWIVTIVRVRSLPTVLLGIAMAASIGLMTVHTQPAPDSTNPDQAAAQPANAGAVTARRSNAGNLISHELAGLTHPGEGTGPLHVTLIAQGFARGFNDPFGLGISQGTIASLKAQSSTPPNPATSVSDESRTQSAENDIANVTAAGGVAAGLALVVFIVLATLGAFRLYRLQPSALHLTWVGFCVVAMTQWLNGSLYSTSAILFIVAGGVSAELGRLRAPERERASPVAELATS